MDTDEVAAYALDAARRAMNESRREVETWPTQR